MKVLLPPPLHWTHVSLNPNFSFTSVTSLLSLFLVFHDVTELATGHTYKRINRFELQKVTRHSYSNCLHNLFLPSLLNSIPLTASLSSPEVHRSEHTNSINRFSRQSVRVADTNPSNQIETLCRRQFPSLWSKVNSLSTVLQLKHCRPTSAATLRNLTFCYASCYKKKDIELFLFKCTSLETRRI